MLSIVPAALVVLAICNKYPNQAPGDFRLSAVWPAHPDSLALFTNYNFPYQTGKDAFDSLYTYTVPAGFIDTAVSVKGTQIANESARQKGYSSHLKFTVADATDNKLPDESFDIVWGMESFHLMDDKARVFAECYRVLKAGRPVVALRQHGGKPQAFRCGGRCPLQGTPSIGKGFWKNPDRNPCWL